MLIRLFAALIIVCMLPCSSWAENITIRVTELPTGNHQYFHELLTHSLEDAGYTVTLQSLGVVPLKRSMEMFLSGETDIRWFHKAKTQELPLVPVRVDLTKDLIGKRILVIPKGQAQIYSHIENLQQFKQLGKVGGFGKGWYDVQVWRKNSLKFMEKDGDWRALYPMVASQDRNVDYLSRGVGEILNEIKEKQDVEVESTLLFSYDSDFWFFLHPSARHLEPIIRNGLIKAQKSGLMDELIEKYWGKDLKELKINQRTVLKLTAPAAE
ncbi:hypothetical protein SYK_24740 [Pseudodesulfovibrio nedwellii]|uniref:Solute-binding protein family 3/N-terminal domain-containing protein n=1 Tax=Pseudodesulfovibrio nedwellii TaxID=2973072 RepID=A0ABN6S4Z2_9BACT|nr:hypothetical protein [Pseudodesulfovibrio nedwellii]BDQ38114.1 hypothetical protein SYK_24740 [Pseudodesulfovibrio nedwellii]